MSTLVGRVFERRFLNQLDDLGRVIEEAVQFLEEQGVDGQAVYITNLAIEEMGTNLLKYGYDDAARHQILLRLELQPGTLVLVLEDDGHEFNPLNAPEPDVHLTAEERDPGGLGIHLVRRLAQDIRYERHEGRNRLTVKIPA